MALEDDTLVMGFGYGGASYTNGYDQNGNINGPFDRQSGVVYIFTRSGSTWSLEKEISERYPPSGSLGTSSYLGSSVSLDGNTLVVGAPGFYSERIFIFTKNNGVWGLQDTISKLDTSRGYPIKPISNRYDYFGASIDINSGVLVAGALGEDRHASSAGGAYVFAQQDDWSQWSAVTQLPDYSHLNTVILPTTSSLPTPVLTAVLNNQDRSIIVTSRVNGQDKTSQGQWSYVRTKTTTCDRNLFFPATNHVNSVSNLDSAYDDQYYCFKFVYNNQKSYLAVQVKFTLSVSLTQSEQTLTASANKAGATWTYKRSENPPNCSQLTYSGANSGTTNTLTLSSTDKDKYYCFKGTLGNQVDYAQIKIAKADQLNIDIVHNQDVLKAEADLTGVTWRYAQTENSQDCSSLTYQATNNTNTINLTADDLESYYCFKATKGNLTAYAKTYVIANRITDLATNDQLGKVTTIDGSKMAISADNAIYVYRRSGDNIWSPQQKLVVDASVTAMDLADNTLVVGSSGYSRSSCRNCGAVYIFVYNTVSGLWSVQQKISRTATNVPTNFTPGMLQTDDYFGSAVALSANTLAVGAYGDMNNHGAVYIFNRSGSTWSLEDEISSYDHFNNPGFDVDTLRNGDHFGYSVALDGNTLAVGAYGDNGSSCWDCGAVYIFVHSGSTWSLEDKISDNDYTNNPGFTSSTLISSDYFGYSVALSGDTLVVGAYGDDNSSCSYNYVTGTYSGICASGAVYIFTRSGSTWSLQDEISITDHSDNTGFESDTLGFGDYFGWSVSLDDDTLAVGTYRDNSSRGAVYVFTRSGSNWSLEDEISSTDHNDNTGFGGTTLSDSDYFGYSASLDGNTLVVGAYGTDGDTSCSSCGAGYLFTQTLGSTTWQLVKTVEEKPSKLPVSGKKFGTAVAIDGDTLVVGAYEDNSSRGAVYVFTRSGNTWSLQQEISSTSTVSGFTSSTLKSNDYFGYSVALDNDTLAVGAYLDNASGCTDCGAVYIFTRSGSTWSLEDEISSTDHSDNTGFESDTLKYSDHFGYSVALDGNTLAIGARYDSGNSNYYHNNYGAVYIFTRSGGTWSLEDEISSTDHSDNTGFESDALGSSDYFGYSVALDGDTLAVGAYGDSSSRGAVYVFTRSGTTWSLEDEISSTDHSDNTGFTASTLNNNDYFGYSVALSGNTLAVGAYGDDGSNCSNCGAVYIFTRSGSTWSLEKKIADDSLVTGFTDTTLNGNDEFGKAVSLDNDTLVVSAPGDYGISRGHCVNGYWWWGYYYCNSYFDRNRGAVYVFTRSGSTWILKQEISESTGLTKLRDSDNFGNSIAMAGNYLVGGAPGISNSGAVHVFNKINDYWELVPDTTQTVSFGVKVLNPTGSGIVPTIATQLDTSSKQLTSTGSVSNQDKSLTGDWQYVRRYSAKCDRSVYFYGGATNLVGLDEDNDDGKYYCFRFTYNDQKAYASQKVDFP